MASIVRSRPALRWRPSPLTLAIAVLLPVAAAAQEVQRITVTGSAAPPPVSVGGFGDVEPSRLPMATATVDAQRLADAGTTQLSGLTREDASVSDAYNAEGYWSILSVRGYVLDNRFNYRRDGLPINAETALPLASLERLEVLKGTSGIQAGTSAPGGLVNLVVKRPDTDLRSGRLEWREAGSVGAAVDLSQRFGTGREAGLRLNLAYEHLDPSVRDARGQRHVAALAGDWRPVPGTRLEAEVETFGQRQPSVPGFSLLGSAVPSPNAIDPRTNLNDQPWTQPVVFAGTTGSLRWTQDLAADWRFVAHGLVQRLTTDDRTAFPFGCDAEGNYDRFCSDGTFDLYEYVSDDERRRSDALDLRVEGSASTGAWRHALTAGVLFSRYRATLRDQVFAYAGVGAIDGSLPPTPPSSGELSPNTDRRERSTEWYLRDRIDLAADWQLWAGLRHTRLHRQSTLTSPDEEGSLRPTRYEESATLPWLALTHQPAAGHTLYASWGQGLESDVAPNLPVYTNAGQPLPALKSRQAEVGWKLRRNGLGAGVTLFDIVRPVSADLCDETACTRARDGDARHRGLEAQVESTTGRWGWRASALWLDAERRGSTDDAVDGTRPSNVPTHSLRLGATVRPAVADGLVLAADVVSEGGRELRLAGDPATYRIDGWTRVDLGARWTQRVAATSLTWRVGVDNVTDRRAWKEAPVQFGHAWLFPMAPRTWRVSLQADL